MNPPEIRALRERLGLSQREFGEALGLGDPARVLRAWEKGERRGAPYGPTGSALACVGYVVAILEALEMPTPQQARQRLLDALPACIAEKA